MTHRRLTASLVRAATAAAAAAAVASLGSCAAEPPLEVYEIGGDFALTDQRGEPFHLRQRRGRVQLLFFGFTSCPAACPAALSRLAAVVERLPAGSVDVLFVSVDPERDTPERLAQFAAGYGLPMTGLTGTGQEIAGVARQYAAGFRPTPDGSGGGIDHSTRIYLIDGQGRVRRLFASDDPVEEMAAVVRRLL